MHIIKKLFSSLFLLALFSLFVGIVTHPVSARLLGIASAEAEIESSSDRTSQLADQVATLTRAVATLTEVVRAQREAPPPSRPSVDEVWQPCQDLATAYSNMENLDPFAAPLQIAVKNIEVTARLTLCQEHAKHAGYREEAETAHTLLNTLRPLMNTAYIEAQRVYGDTLFSFSQGTSHGQVIRARGSLAIHPSAGNYLSAPADHPRPVPVSSEYRPQQLPQALEVNPR